MRVLDPRELDRRREERLKQHESRRHKLFIVPLITLIILVYAGYALVMPLPGLKVRALPINLPSATVVPDLPWPGYGQAAVGAVGYGLLAQKGDPKPLPIASVAKVITALAVLKVRPIYPGESVRKITITAADVAVYNKNLSEGQSGIKVIAGQQLTQYQALQALLLPSANNMADVLVAWAFGSTADYLAFVNPFIKSLGMNTTNIADASGFLPQTTSVAADLTKLAEIAMNNPTIAEIVNQPQAELPVAGVVYNVNRLVGKNGIIGIKTGNTDEAGGCYLFAARRQIDANHEVTVVGTIMGAADLSTAIDASVPLIDAAFKNFKVITPLTPNQKVATINQPGGQEIAGIVEKTPTLLVWSSQKITTEFKSAELGSTLSTKDTVGALTITVGEQSHQIQAVANASVIKPNFWHRLRRPILPL